MSLYKKPDSEVWWASISLGGGRVRFSTGEYDRRQAQKVHDRRKAQQHDAPVLKGRTWGSAVLEWAKVKNPSASELEYMERICKHYHDRTLSSVTADSLAKVLGKLFPHPSTYNRNRARVQGMLKCSDVVMRIPKRKQDVPTEPRWLTHEEWVHLEAELPDHQRWMARFAVSTGLRQANVLNLKWPQVDIERKLVRIDASAMKGKKALSIPLNSGAMSALINVQGIHPEFVFTYKGKPISEIKTAFQAACVRARCGEFTSGGYAGFTWHGLRHTWATWHVQNGTPLSVLQVLGGWADYKMVLIYAHHAPGHLASFADNITTKEKK